MKNSIKCTSCDDRFLLNSVDGAYLQVFKVCKKCNELDQKMKKELLVSLYKDEPIMMVMMKLHNKYYKS